MKSTTLFKPVHYPAELKDRRFQRVERVIENEEVKEVLGPIYRVATMADEGRKDSLVLYDPEDFVPFRVVPIEPVAR